MHFDKGSADLDQVIKVLFGTASFTGGFIGFMLDNIVPGEWQFVWILSKLYIYNFLLNN